MQFVFAPIFTFRQLIASCVPGLQAVCCDFDLLLNLSGKFSACTSITQLTQCMIDWILSYRLTYWLRHILRYVEPLRSTRLIRGTVSLMASWRQGMTATPAINVFVHVRFLGQCASIPKDRENFIFLFNHQYLFCCGEWRSGSYSA